MRRAAPALTAPHAGPGEGGLPLANKAHTHARGRGQRRLGCSGFLSALAKEGGRRGGEAKYRLVQALKAVIRLAAAVAHPGGLAGTGPSVIQRVSG